MPTFPIFRWLQFSSLWTYRLATWAVLICAFVFALMVVGARFWLLPNIEDYRETIARDLSAAIGQRVTIGRLEGRWSGFNLQLTLVGFAVFDRAGQAALRFERIDSSLSWWSMIHWEPRFNSLEIRRPELNIRRDKRGVISVAGIELSGSTDGGGLSDWLLRQEAVVIRDASITWRDELRGAPELALKQVDFRLENAGRHHRFGLRAVPPRTLSTPLDVRGDITGKTVRDLAQWNGQLFAQIDHTEIPQWRDWLHFPVSFPRGTGAVRIWLDLKNGAPAQIAADVQLSQVRTRLGAELPELELDTLKGRVGWKLLEDGFEVSTSGLEMAARGVTLQPMDLLLRYRNAGERRPPGGELRASTLELGPLVGFAGHLPLDAGLRHELGRYAPRGNAYDVAVKWSGSWPQPEQYSVKGSFVDLGLNAVGRLPGFVGISGNVDGSERGGQLHLNTRNATLDLPRVFQSRLGFDALTAQVGWRGYGGQYEIKLNNITFSNPDLSGSVSGSYQTVADSRGVIDLSGSLTRAEARGVARYIPLQVAEGARRWLDRAFLGGTSKDVKLRLKGNLDDFPFPAGRGGIFQVAARVSGGVLDYASGWPKIENIEGNLAFRGTGMDIVVREASILGAKLTRVRAQLPNLGAPGPVLTVSGEADGPTGEFLSFIEHSPVYETIDRFTEGIQAEGRGKLALKLTIPLDDTRNTKVAGGYQFINNRLQSTGVLFPFEQVNGRLEFTEAVVRVPKATMSVLGGPATITGVTQSDGAVRLNMAGRVNLEKFRRTTSAAWAQALQGETDWRTSVTLRKRRADIVFESTLQGIASELPAPLAKAAADSLPFKFERRVTGAQQDRLAFTLGGVISAQLQRRREGENYIVERGSISLGGAAADPARKGVWVSGSLKSLDLDEWLALLKSTPVAAGTVELGGLDLRLGSLDAFGRRFGELAITGSVRGGLWQSELIGRELVGEVTWRAQGKGKVIARMKKLVIPAAVPRRTIALADKDQPLELPELDIAADHFQINDKSLGRLELTALPEGRDWRLERLHIANPDATLKIDGLWQNWRTQPRTTANVKLEVADIGNLLLRLGYPEGIKRGTATLEGPLSWTGNPSEVDYATLSGNYVLQAHKGQFMKLDPGIGKLLGVLSLQALPRRLTLDFRDIFSEGLAFDEIVGTVQATRGVAATENFRIQGPAVRVQLSGEVNLGAETQKLRVKVFPSVSDSVSVAGALIGGPLAGVASFLMQKVLKDPFGQMVAYEYGITGTWADPQVSKIETAQAEK